MTVEVCANSIQSALNAQVAGADRIELCQNLAEGGTTPSYAAIDFCVRELQIPTFVLIRPRAGDFCYSETELHLIAQEVLQCKKMGVVGVVVGFLNADFTVDVEATSKIVALAAPMQVTFHRAFDLCIDHAQALEAVVGCGCHRILTSGGATSALAGVDVLKKIIDKAASRIKIIAAAGINAQNVATIINKTHVDEVHASCKHSITTAEPTHSLLKQELSNFTYTESNILEIKQLIKNSHIHQL
ncbi:MAG: copper homeostasis protein CutC [Bacteroidales bacterium]|jgi:copper homeostasis protein|nr:copper homeostasis protein CutC [Bacteroidales bacterium]